MPIDVQNWVVRAHHGSHKKLRVKKAVDQTKKGKRRLPFVGTELELRDTREECGYPGQPNFLSK